MSEGIPLEPPALRVRRLHEVAAIDDLVTTILDGLAAVGGRRAFLDVTQGPGTLGAAVSLANPGAWIDHVVPRGVRPSSSGHWMHTVELDAHELWTLGRTGRRYDLVAIDRPPAAEALFQMLSQALPLLTEHGIAIVHPYSDYLAMEPYRRQNDGMAAVNQILAVVPGAQLRRLRGQVWEICRRGAKV